MMRCADRASRRLRRTSFFHRLLLRVVVFGGDCDFVARGQHHQNQNHHQPHALFPVEEEEKKKGKHAGGLNPTRGRGERSTSNGSGDDEGKRGWGSRVAIHTTNHRRRRSFSTKTSSGLKSLVECQISDEISRLKALKQNYGNEKVRRGHREHDHGWDERDFRVALRNLSC